MTEVDFGPIVDKLIKGGGGGTKLARTMKMTRQNIYAWKQRGVPIHLILKLEEKTGVPRWEIRPDYYEPGARRRRSV